MLCDLEIGRDFLENTQNINDVKQTEVYQNLKLLF